MFQYEPNEKRSGYSEILTHIPLMLSEPPNIGKQVFFFHLVFMAGIFLTWQNIHVFVLTSYSMWKGFFSQDDWSCQFLAYSTGEECS